LKLALPSKANAGCIIFFLPRTPNFLRLSGPGRHSLLVILKLKWLASGDTKLKWLGGVLRATYNTSARAIF
jgi:hypothetical protein